MPPEASDPFPRSAPDDQEPAVPRRPWRVVLLTFVVRVCEAIARTSDRIAGKARTAAGMPASGRGPVVTGDVVTDDEIEASRRLFGLDAPAVDTTPGWTH